MTYKTHILTDQSVVVIFSDGSMKPVPVENPMYGKVQDALYNHKFDLIPNLVDLAIAIREHASGRFMVANGLVFIDNDILPDTLSSRLIDFVENDPPLDTTALEHFWDNLKANPSLKSREMLYSFLEHNGIPITADGCFIAYKRVDDDYLDCYSHKFDNSVGSVVVMDRDKVDADSSRTCSTGLHVAAYPYAKDFYSNGHLMEVKVNPFDVVSVPDDYNGQKMRVCKYEVVRECDGPRPDSEHLYKYDDSADEDVWDDDVNDDNWDDDVDDEDWGDNVGNTVIKVDDVVVKPDNRGRVCVPKSMIDALGLSENDPVVAEIGNDEIILYGDKSDSSTKVKTDSSTRVYIVDKDHNIRISAYALDLAGLGHRKMLNIGLDEDVIIVW